MGLIIFVVVCTVAEVIAAFAMAAYPGRRNARGLFTGRIDWQS